MKNLGCVEAMNLDGGGSETLVLEGRAINHPSDRT
jgi:exopolysaccharide biosynthesis protein